MNHKTNQRIADEADAGHELFIFYCSFSRKPTADSSQAIDKSAH